MADSGADTKQWRTFNLKNKLSNYFIKFDKLFEKHEIFIWVESVNLLLEIPSNVSNFEKFIKFFATFPIINVRTFLGSNINNGWYL